MFLRSSRIQAYIFQSSWKQQDAAFAMLMLAKVTLLAVMLFLAWLDKWSEVCMCDLIQMWFCFGQFCFLGLLFFFFVFHFLKIVVGQWMSKMANRILMDGILNAVASWFPLNPTVLCAETRHGEEPSVQGLGRPFGFDLDLCPCTPIQKDLCWELLNLAFTL